MNQRCFFLGQEKIPASLRPLLVNTIRRHITEEGVRLFIVGSHGKFNHMAAVVLSELKNEYPDIENQMALAYHPSIKQVKLPDGFDESFYPEEQELSPLRRAIPSLNRGMIRLVDYLIAYVEEDSADGAQKIFQYAKSLQKTKQLAIANIAELQPEQYKLESAEGQSSGSKE